LIHYMLTEEAYEPWDVIGEPPARTDLQEKLAKKYNYPSNYKTKLWFSDTVYNYKTAYDYMQFALTLGK
jgi:hypothetical protein